MKHLLTFAALAAFCTSANLVRGDEPVTIKRKDPAAGDIYQVHKTETATTATKVINPSSGKALLDNKQVTTETSIYRETILQCEGGKPTQLERAYEKAQLTTDGKTADLPYQGKTVRIEKKDGRYHFMLNGKELTYEEAAPLIKEFTVGCDEKADLERAVVPAQPVRLRGSWKLNLTPFLTDAKRDGEMGLVGERAQGTATLKKVYQQEGRPRAEIAVRLTLPLQSLGKGVLKIKTQDGSVATVDLDLDGCIDGDCNSAIIKTTMKVDAKSSMALPDGSKAPMTVSLQSRSEEVRQDITRQVSSK